MMHHIRDCGECNYCCIISAIHEGCVDKLIYTPCQFLKGLGKEKACLVYDKRPKMCSSFNCAWSRNYGNENDRPDKNKIMININNLNGGTWIFVFEMEKDAAITTGKNIIMDIANKIDLPVIIADYGVEMSYGDRTIVKKSLLHRTTSMRGECLGFLDEGKKEKVFGIYKLIYE